MWENEAVLLFNDTKHNSIWLHLPFGYAADAWDGIPIQPVVKRNMTVQLTIMVVAWCQEGDETLRGKMDCSFHDARVVKKVNVVFDEDTPTADTKSKRWNYLMNRLVDGSDLHQAIVKQLEKKETANAGHKSSKGKTKS